MKMKNIVLISALWMPNGILYGVIFSSDLPPAPPIPNAANSPVLSAQEQAAAAQLLNEYEQRRADALSFVNATITNKADKSLTITLSGCSGNEQTFLLPAGASKKYGQLVNNELYTLYNNLIQAYVMQAQTSVVRGPVPNMPNKSQQPKINPWKKKYDAAQSAVRDYVAQAPACTISIRTDQPDKNIVLKVNQHDLSEVSRESNGLMVEQESYDPNVRVVSEK